jgi:uncharacterized membrane protein
MTVRPDFLLFVLALGSASLACRFCGFWIMRFVAITPRVEAALRATPVAVMVGLVVPAAMRGSVVELAGIAVAAIAMKLTGSDLLAAVIGVAVVAVGRSLQLAG